MARASLLDDAGWATDNVGIEATADVVPIVVDVGRDFMLLHADDWEVVDGIVVA